MPGHAALPKASEADSEKRALDHVRPASLRLSRLYRPSGAEDAEHRCDGQARRAVLQRLCAVADLRPVADVVLYRPLHALARLALERLAAAHRRTDARRPPEEDRRPQRAGRQDPYGAGPGGPEESRHPPGLDHRRPTGGTQGRALRAGPPPASARPAAARLFHLY